MITVDVSHSESNHIQRFVAGLAKAGWHAIEVPSGGILRANHQLIELRSPALHLKARIGIFAVGDRGEAHRRDERRIQITTTYLSGLRRLGDYEDIVLGYDPANSVYVGLDPRRLAYGGKKHNASSSVERTALQSIATSKIVIRPHDTQLLGLEYQAIFTSERIGEYMFNLDSIHRGSYVANGLFSGTSNSSGNVIDNLTVSPATANGNVLVLAASAVSRRNQKAKRSSIEAYERRDWSLLSDVSPEELEVIRQRCCEAGDRGEAFVYNFEKERLRKAGKVTLASQIDWVSRRSVGKGYDILSYEEDGSPRFIEVKSSTGRGMTVFMSDNEWQVAKREKGAYYIYRVTNVATAPVLFRVVRNPLDAEEQQLLERTATGWRIRLK